jgi:endonuclease/exonuclease/phosphatase (EEP) superfamily protein YafD
LSRERRFGRLFSRLFVIAAIGGLLPLGATIWWGFELLSHFRVQYAILAMLLAVLAAAARMRRVALLLGGMAALNAWPLLPYLPIAPATLESPIQLDVLNINVNAGNTDFAAIADAIRAADADLVAIIELTPELAQALRSLDDRYPYRFTAPDNGNFGVGLLSRYPLKTLSTLAIDPTAAIDSLVELPTRSIRFVAAHLYPPIGARMAATRNRQLEQLALYASSVDEPLLVCGDFNLTPYSPHFDRLTRTGRIRDVRLGQGIGISWPSFLPAAGIPIDHCLFRGPFAVKSVKRLARFGSDHYPVLVSLVWQEDE